MNIELPMVDPCNPPNEFQQARIADARSRIAAVLEGVLDFKFSTPAFRVRDGDK